MNFNQGERLDVCIDDFLSTKNKNHVSLYMETITGVLECVNLLIINEDIETKGWFRFERPAITKC